MLIEAAVSYAGEPKFRIENLELDGPRENEILVKIAGVGICHSDLTFSSGAIEYPFPAVFGHEGSGTVEAVGTKVKKVAPGDRVILTFRYCEHCACCDAGDPSYCHNWPALNVTGRREDASSAFTNEHGNVSSNFFGQSSFASHAITYESNVVKVSEDVPLDIMGPLGCGIQTGAGTVMRSMQARAGSAILITGGGSVGLSAVMGAVLRECRTIILVEPHQSRRNLATELGATHCIDPNAVDDIAAAVRAIIPGGVDYAIDTTGVPSVQEKSIESLGIKGTLGIVGVSPPGAQPPVEMNTLMTFGQSILGIMEGDSDPDQFIPELIDLFRKGQLPFDRMVKTFSLGEINEAITSIGSGECVKAVLLPDS